MDTKYTSKLLLIVLISIYIITDSCFNKLQESDNLYINYNKSFITAFLNDYFLRATDAFIVVNVMNKSGTYPAITTLECLENYIIENTNNKNFSNLEIKDECRNYLLNDSVLMYNIGVLYTPNPTEELWAAKGKNKYIKHYAPNYLIIEDLTEHELYAVIYRLIKWEYFVHFDGWGFHVIEFE